MFKHTKYMLRYHSSLGLSRVAWILITGVVSLAALGWLLLYSAAGGEAGIWADRQVMTFIIFGLIAWIISFIPLEALYYLSYYSYSLCLIFLVLAELCGHSAMGAQRWLRFGPLSFQPSELMKIGLIMALARYLHSLHIREIQRITSLIQPTVLVVLPILLILRQPSLGTTVIVAVIGLCILFVAGVRIWKFALVLSVAIVLTPIVWHELHSYQKQRVLTFLQPEADPRGAGYNIIQSKIAIGSGGVYGKGLMLGSQSQLSFLPEKHTDFIFTLLAEEQGLRGVALLFSLYTLILTTCYLAAFRASSHYSRLLAIGVATLIFSHLLINIAMVSGLIPVVGVPLPFLSYGRSNLSCLLLGVGLVLNSIRHHDTSIKAQAT